jgi:prefoldin subunit 5
MTPDSRLDYFRSEFEGKLSKARKELGDSLAASSERIAQLEKSVNELVREVKMYQMSGR